MNRLMWGVACGVVLLGSGLAAVGCNDEAPHADGGDTTGVAMVDTTMSAPPVQDVAETPLDSNLSDAGIVALLESTNRAAIEQSELALQKTSSDLVRAFAEMLRDEHRKLQQRVESVAGAQELQPEPSAEERNEAFRQQRMQVLNTVPPGPAFDTTYVGMQITAHKKLLSDLAPLQAQADNDSLRALIGDAIPLTRMYLDRARAMHGMLGP